MKTLFVLYAMAVAAAAATQHFEPERSSLHGARADNATVAAGTSQDGRKNASDLARPAILAGHTSSVHRARAVVNSTTVDQAPSHANNATKERQRIAGLHHRFRSNSSSNAAESTAPKTDTSNLATNKTSSGSLTRLGRQAVLPQSDDAGSSDGDSHGTVSPHRFVPNRNRFRTQSNNDSSEEPNRNNSDDNTSKADDSTSASPSITHQPRFGSHQRFSPAVNDSRVESGSDSSTSDVHRTSHSSSSSSHVPSDNGNSSRTDSESSGSQSLKNRLERYHQRQAARSSTTTDSSRDAASSSQDDSSSPN